MEDILKTFETEKGIKAEIVIAALLNGIESVKNGHIDTVTVGKDFVADCLGHYYLFKNYGRTWEVCKKRN